MIRLRGSLDTRKVVRSLARLPGRTRKITAQELNKQRKRSKTLIVRGLANRLNIKPQKRVRRRVLLPRGGFATERKLRADALALVETMPGRYFAKGTRGRGGGFTLVTAGGSKIKNTRQTTGQPFFAEMASGHVGVMRRVDPKTKRYKGGDKKKPTWLPIQEVMVDTSVPGYAERQKALDKLGKEWNEQWTKRMKGELKRAFK